MRLCFRIWTAWRNPWDTSLNFTGATIPGRWKSIGLRVGGRAAELSAVRARKLRFAIRLKSAPGSENGLACCEFMQRRSYAARVGDPQFKKRVLGKQRCVVRICCK